MRVDPFRSSAIGKDSSQLPQPLVHAPGDTVLAIRPDVVSGRRFSLPAERNDHND
jgi:hypothetical protein